MDSRGSEDDYGGSFWQTVCACDEGEPCPSMVPGSESFTFLTLLLAYWGNCVTRNEKLLTQCYIVNLHIPLLVLRPVLGARNRFLTSYSPNGRVNSSGPAVFTFSFPHVCSSHDVCDLQWQLRAEKKKSSTLLGFGFLSLKILKVCLGQSGFWRETVLFSVLGGTNSVSAALCFLPKPLPALCRQIFLSYDILWSWIRYSL